MRVYISCDIEGITTTTMWEETDPFTYPARTAPHLKQMTAEVKAACEGAIAAGADYILVKDAHESGTNIDITQLPDCVEVQRSWSGSYHSMAQGVEEGFDAAMYIGYHSPAGSDGSPLAHTLTRNMLWIKINGELTSEFMLYSWLAAKHGVPSVFLSGDKRLCEESVQYHPALKTVAVKQGFGAATRSINPGLACKRIREESEKALRQDLTKALGKVPEKFVMEICYREHLYAAKMLKYPGMTKVDDNTLHFETTELDEVLRALAFVQ